MEKIFNFFFFFFFVDFKWKKLQDNSEVFVELKLYVRFLDYDSSRI